MHPNTIVISTGIVGLAGEQTNHPKALIEYLIKKGMK